MKINKIVIFCLLICVCFNSKVKAQHLYGDKEDRIYFQTNEFYRNPALLDVQNPSFRITNEERFVNPIVSNTSLTYFNKIKNYSFAISTSFNYSGEDYEDGGVALHSVYKFSTIESFHKYKLSKIITIGMELSYRRTSWTLFRRPFYDSYNVIKANMFSINGGISLDFNNYTLGLNYRNHLNSTAPPFISDNQFSIQNIYKTKKMIFWCVFNISRFYIPIASENENEIDLITNIGLSYSFNAFDVFTQYNLNAKRTYLNVKFNTKQFNFILGGFVDFEKDNYRRETNTVGINNSLYYNFK